MAGTTDLATVASQLPAHLRGAQSNTFEEFAGGLSQGIPLPFLSIRGKEFRLRKDGQELNTRQRELSVIFIAARHNVSKRYYEKQYESGSLEAPDCSSRDGVIPDVAQPVHPNCTHCPKNQWGSRITEGGKEGKACSDYKRVVMWPNSLTDEPVVLDVAATSLKAPKGQKHAVLMMGEYLSQLAKHGMDPTQVVTKVAFTDAEYPQLCFTFERYVTEEEWARVQELRDSDDVAVCIDNPVFEEGEKTEDNAPAPDKPKRTRKPKAEKKPDPPKSTIPDFPGVATIMKDGDNMIIAQDAQQWAEAWEEGFRPQETGQLKRDKAKEAPEKEPAPETETAGGDEPEGEPEGEPEKEAPAAEPDKSDLLAEVAAMLGKK